MSNHIGYIDNKDFTVYLSNFRSQVFGIKIPEGISPGSAKVIIAQIDEVYSQLRFDYGILQAERSRVDSLIKEIERASATGKNETDRKKNATDAVREYKAEGEGPVYNLYKMYQQINYRYEMIDALVDILEKKQNRLITLSGLLKLDKELSPGV